MAGEVENPCGTDELLDTDTPVQAGDAPPDPDACTRIVNCTDPVTGETVPVEVTVTGFTFTGDVNVSPDGPVVADICVGGVQGVLMGQCNDGVGTWKAHDLGAGVVSGVPAAYEFGDCPLPPEPPPVVPYQLPCGSGSSSATLTGVEATTGAAGEDPVPFIGIFPSVEGPGPIWAPLITGASVRVNPTNMPTANDRQRVWGWRLQAAACANLTGDITISVSANTTLHSMTPATPGSDPDFNGGLLINTTTFAPASPFGPGPFTPAEIGDTKPMSGSITVPAADINDIMLVIGGETDSAGGGTNPDTLVDYTVSDLVLTVSGLDLSGCEGPAVDVFKLCPADLAEIVDALACPPESTQTIESGQDINVPAGLKTVTINNLNGVTAIDGGFELGNGRRPDSLSLDSTNHPCINGLLPEIVLTGGSWQWVGVR